MVSKNGMMEGSCFDHKKARKSESKQKAQSTKYEVRLKRCERRCVVMLE